MSLFVTDSLASLDDLYETGVCKRKMKKKACVRKPAPAPEPKPQPQVCITPDVTELMTRIEKMEMERRTMRTEFDEFIRKTNAEQKNIADSYEKRIYALQQDLEEWKRSYSDAADKNTELTLQLGALDEQLDKLKVDNSSLEADVTGLKAELAAIRNEAEKQRRELIDEATDDKKLKDDLVKAEDRARRASQELASAKNQIDDLKGAVETGNAKVRELEVELTETSSQLVDSNVTNETLFTSVEQFNVFLKTVQAEPIGVQSSLPKFSPDQVVAIAGAMNTDAIFQSKREKAGSLVVDYFKALMDTAKRFGAGVASGNRDTLKEALKNNLKKATDVADKIEKFFPNGGSVGTPLKGITKSFGIYLDDLYVLMRKTRKQITAREIEEIITDKGFPAEAAKEMKAIPSGSEKEPTTAAVKFANKKFPNNAREAAEVVKQLIGMYQALQALIGSIEATNKDKHLEFEEVIEEPLKEIMENLIYYSTSQVSRIGVNLNTADKKRDQIIKEAKEIGYQAYGAITGDTEKSLVERARKLNPFKEQVPSSSSSTSTKAVSSKSPFKQNFTSSNSKMKITLKTINM